MNDARPTLATFFRFENTPTADPDELSALASAEQVAHIKDALQRQTEGHDWSVVPSQLHSHIGELLDIRLQDILVRAWKENKLLDKFLNPQAYDPDEALLLSLKKHTISSQHKPHIDVAFNGEAIGRIDFDIDLSFTLEGIILKIQAGRIHEIRAGNVQGRGTLSMGKLTLLKRDLCDITLPGVISIAEPAYGHPIAAKDSKGVTSPINQFDVIQPS